MSDLVGNPNCWFSHAQAHFILMKTRNIFLEDVDSNGELLVLSLIIQIKIRHIQCVSNVFVSVSLFAQICNLENNSNSLWLHVAKSTG